MTNFTELTALYAESRLQAEWHSDQCGCDLFPVACSTYNESEYFWRRNAPYSWSAEVLTEKVMAFIEQYPKMHNDAIATKFTEALADARMLADVEEDDFIYVLFPLAD